MNKLYILGALALANVEASIALTTNGAYAVTYTLPTVGVAGAYTYTATADCFSTGTATSLGMNNIYHQYYSFTLAKGTAAFSTLTIIVILPITPAPVATSTATIGYNACYHSHLYNWMAQPQVAVTTSVTGGFGSGVVAYGYAMSGTAVTSCTSATVVTTSLFKSNTFYGAQYQSSIGIYNALTSITSAAITVPFWGKVGPAYYVAKAAIALTWTQTAPASAGLSTTTS